MSCTQLAFNSGDLAFQEIITSRPYRDSDRPIVAVSSGLPTIQEEPHCVGINKTFTRRC
jgi:hypothetical protein